MGGGLFTQSCLTLATPCTVVHQAPSGSSDHGILQAIILEWAISFSEVWLNPGDIRQPVWLEQRESKGEGGADELSQVSRRRNLKWRGLEATDQEASVTKTPPSPLAGDSPSSGA